MEISKVYYSSSNNDMTPKLSPVAIRPTFVKEDNAWSIEWENTGARNIRFTITDLFIDSKRIESEKEIPEEPSEIKFKIFTKNATGQTEITLQELTADIYQRIKFPKNNQLKDKSTEEIQNFYLETNFNNY